MSYFPNLVEDVAADLPCFEWLGAAEYYGRSEVASVGRHSGLQTRRNLG